MMQKNSLWLLNKGVSLNKKNGHLAFLFYFHRDCFTVLYKWIQCAATVYISHRTKCFRNIEKHTKKCVTFIIYAWFYMTITDTSVPWLLMDLLQINLNIHHITECMDDSNLKWFSAVSTFKSCRKSILLQIH